MTNLSALLAFTLAATILTITPGVDTAMVLRTAASGGARPAMLAGTGIAIGCLVWGGAVSLGLAALITASPLAFTLLTWAGAAYLAWMGATLLLKPRNHFGDGAIAGRDSLRQGLVTNLLNPKIGVFYLTFLPQFIPAGANVPLFSFGLAAIHVALSILWFALLISATVPISRLLRYPAVMRGLDRLTGAVFIGFGLKLAVSR